MSINPKDMLNNNKNLNKRVDVAKINVDNVSVEDLTFNGNNYDKYINLVSLLEVVSSCQISDAYLQVSNRTPVINNIKPINNKKVWGSVFTAETTSDDWGTSAIAIDEADFGDVIVFKVDDTDKAIWGELASLSAQNNGIKATVIYGSARDRDALLYMDYPVFASDYCPNAGSALGLGNVRIPLEIENVKINPGDFLFGDENGVIVIPKQLFKDTMIQTLNVKIKEGKIIDSLNEGLNLARIAGLKK